MKSGDFEAEAAMGDASPIIETVDLIQIGRASLLFLQELEMGAEIGEASEFAGVFESPVAPEENLVHVGFELGLFRAVHGEPGPPSTPLESGG